MKLKQTLAAAAIAAIAAMTTTSVLAQTPAADALTSTEMASLFEQDAQPLQLAVLSGEEMKTTEGAWIWWQLPRILRFGEIDDTGFVPVKFDLLGRLHWRRDEPW